MRRTYVTTCVICCSSVTPSGLVVVDSPSSFSFATATATLATHLLVWMKIEVLQHGYLTQFSLIDSKGSLSDTLPVFFTKLKLRLIYPFLNLPQVAIMQLFVFLSFLLGSLLGLKI